MIVRVTTTSRPQQRYDHRLRDLVRRTGDVTLATDLGVPRSTARGWIRAAPTVVMSLEVADLTEPELRQEILRLRRRVQKLAALLRLALALLQTSGFRLSDARLPDGEDKLRILPWIRRGHVFRCGRFSGSCICRRIGFRRGADGRAPVRSRISRPVLARHRTD